MSLMLIFDFDNTLIDADSDEWVAQQFGAVPLFDALRHELGLPWNEAVNSMLRSLHAQGITIAHVDQALRRIPLPHETILALEATHRLRCELRILSDANTFFINAVLNHHRLSNLFSHIHTNPFSIDAHGCLQVGSFHAATSSSFTNPVLTGSSSSLPHPAVLPHNCPLCPPNLCKGRVIDAIRTIHDRTSTKGSTVPIMYAGDGAGDLCPSLRLTSKDCVLARRGYPLAELLSQKYLAVVKARVCIWDSLATGIQEGLHALNSPLPYCQDENIIFHSMTEVEGATSCTASALQIPILKPAIFELA